MNWPLAGKFDEAQRAYDAAIAGDHTNPLAWIDKASVMKVLGRYDEAGACFDAALAGISAWIAADGQDIERVAAFVSMLWVLKAEALLYAEKPDEVIDALDRARAGGVPDATALAVRGQAYALKEEFSKAGDCFYQAEEWCNTHEDSMLTQVWLCKVHLAKTAGGRLSPPYAAEMYAEKRGFKQPEGTPEEDAGTGKQPEKRRTPLRCSAVLRCCGGRVDILTVRWAPGFAQAKAGRRDFRYTTLIPFFNPYIWNTYGRNCH